MTATIKQQVRRNAVALISLVIAITSLGYNTWRNEHSEFNRNQRLASFHVLLKIGELEELVFHNVYDPEFANAGNARSGWALVLTIRDLTQVIDEPVPTAAEELHATWTEHWSGIEKRNLDSKDTVRDAINALRETTLQRLSELD
jgi:hypothetical protein